jgi:hypothetical protein
MSTGRNVVDGENPTRLVPIDATVSVPFSGSRIFRVKIAVGDALRQQRSYAADSKGPSCCGGRCEPVAAAEIDVLVDALDARERSELPTNAHCGEAATHEHRTP